MPNELPRPDAIVSELEALNFFAWRASFRRVPLILWGHGKSYVNDANAAADRLEWELAKRAFHIMTYAQSGRDYLVEHGSLPPHRVTAIGNSTDSAVLRAETTRLREAEVLESAPSSRALYVGGLDPSKRIEFLLDAASAAHDAEPDFHLTIVGRGILEERVREWSGTRTYVTYIPETRGASLAALGDSCSAIWMPGRVGLVAVDALAMGLPIHTTAHPYHAPEIEFLRDEELALLPNSPSQFALASLKSMKHGRPALRADIPTIDSVAGRFVAVVRSAWSPQSPLPTRAI